MDNPCKFCTDDNRYKCVLEGKCLKYTSVIICRYCDNIAYRDDFVNGTCPYCKESVLKEYHIEISYYTTVKALDADDAHEIARNEAVENKNDLDVTYCDEV